MTQLLIFETTLKNSYLYSKELLCKNKYFGKHAKKFDKSNDNKRRHINVPERSIIKRIGPDR